MKPINLNKARKARARVEKSAKGAANAAKFGRGKAEKTRDAAQVQTLRRKLDQHKLDR